MLECATEIHSGRVVGSGDLGQAVAAAAVAAAVASNSAAILSTHGASLVYLPFPSFPSLVLN